MTSAANTQSQAAARTPQLSATVVCDRDIEIKLTRVDLRGFEGLASGFRLSLDRQFLLGTQYVEQSSCNAGAASHVGRIIVLRIEK